MNGSMWTGGQYSVYRVLLGGYLIVHFLQLLPWATELFSAQGMVADAAYSPLINAFPNVLGFYDQPWFVMLLVVSAAMASFMFLLGYKDKWAAVWVWFVLACLFGRNPLIANPALPYLGWMLLAHLFIPSAPYGSVAALGRTNPAGSWRMPRSVFVAAWGIMALTYTYSGYTKLLSPSWLAGDTVSLVLQNPLARDYFLRDIFLLLPDGVLGFVTHSILWVEYLFLPLVFVPFLRRFMWEAMFIVQLGFLFLLNFPDLTVVMLLFHLLTFDPAWLSSDKPNKTETIFYDGDCGLCHRVVRFVLSEDKAQRFNFSPIGSPYFDQVFAPSEQQTLPDSFILVNDKGEHSLEGAAVIELLVKLGGLWAIFGKVLKCLPLSLTNKLYRFVGARRYRLFAVPNTSCPVVWDKSDSAALMSRFC
ncbi:DCC1-like thiol-disulfide oxidoreductase family protein [Alkalimarinus coralli]|uniref:DCC1-like thiol-disulfide oxidoreductase family protein n=1 Tax=Alkalimarinus coralli TaxID=2935863 RepID=UPI00202B9686|nr:DCC1-like thiol-disulfide oxidoreductase family protein [Alkalimarinus coralli]